MSSIVTIQIASQDHAHDITPCLTGLLILTLLAPLRVACNRGMMMMSIMLGMAISQASIPMPRMPDAKYFLGRWEVETFGSPSKCFMVFEESKAGPQVIRVVKNTCGINSIVRGIDIFSIGSGVLVPLKKGQVCKFFFGMVNKNEYRVRNSSGSVVTIKRINVIR